jgi:signal transduction histidine kinase
MRRKLIELARTEPDAEKLDDRFVCFLCEQCGAFSAALLLDTGTSYSNGKVDFPKGSVGHTALCESGWVTPESLLRRRHSIAFLDLQSFLRKNSFALMVAAPRGSTTPTLIIALGTKTNEWPFTYPEVQRLQNIAELMDNILTRSRLTLQAAMRAKLEHLAMMSRGLAHDLNNLITPVSAFLMHTDEQYPPDSPERDVHAAAKRSVRVMSDYVREALFFSARLTPKFEPMRFEGIFREVLALAAARAAQRDIRLVEELGYNGFVTADAVLIQRMLVNMVGNAIDASSQGQTVTLSVDPGRHGCACLRVSDQGCGIAPENLTQVFEPYFTTKKYGDNLRGFGLGLTICQKIVHLHGGTITVNSQLGRGTTMTIELPEGQNSPAPSPGGVQAVPVPDQVVATLALQS